MEQSMVSVICLCYNHEQFLQEAVDSVLRQTYSDVQLIIVDDASTDQSPIIIQGIKEKYPFVETLLLNKNMGNCAAFNRGLSLVKGTYVIDFAADDVMNPERIYKQVEHFGKLDPTYGVVYSDAIYIDQFGKALRHHFDYLFKKNLLNSIPQGDVYQDVLSKYFIPAPTMMIRSDVLAALNGYDEALVYEDFDFWVRSSRNFKYGFLNEPLTKIRKTGNSMSSGWYKKGDLQLHSTYLVCCKAVELNRNDLDRAALLIRIRYELKQSVFSGNQPEATLFYQLLQKLNGIRMVDTVLRWIGKLELPLYWFRNFYYKLWYSS